MARGIINTRKGYVRISRAGVVLDPGKNTVSSDQYAAIRRDPQARKLFESGLLVVVEKPKVEDAPPKEQAPLNTKGGKPDGKPPQNGNQSNKADQSKGGKPDGK